MQSELHDREQWEMKSVKQLYLSARVGTFFKEEILMLEQTRKVAFIQASQKKKQLWLFLLVGERSKRIIIFVISLYSVPNTRKFSISTDQ